MLTDDTQTARAIDYSLKRWDALEPYLEDGEVPIDNNWIENQIRPWALGRKNSYDPKSSLQAQASPGGGLPDDPCTVRMAA